MICFLNVWIVAKLNIFKLNSFFIRITMILFIMIILHIIADFHLQGCLANLKCKDWWKNHCPQELCANDYKTALLIHSVEWTFIVMLPLFICHHVTFLFFIMFSVNAAVHYAIDDEKANKHSISLTRDQLYHLIQIIITWCILWKSPVLKKPNLRYLHHI